MLGKKVSSPDLVIPDKTMVDAEEIVHCLPWTGPMRGMNRVPVHIRVLHNQVGVYADKIRVDGELGKNMIPGMIGVQHDEAGGRRQYSLHPLHYRGICRAAFEQSDAGVSE